MLRSPHVAEETKTARARHRPSAFTPAPGALGFRQSGTASPEESGVPRSHFCCRSSFPHFQVAKGRCCSERKAIHPSLGPMSFLRDLSGENTSSPCGFILSCSPVLLPEAILILSVPKAGPDESWNEQGLLMFFSEERFQASKLHLPKEESVQDAEWKWYRASDTKGTRTWPFTGFPKSQNEAHAAAAKCRLFPAKCYRSRWKPATPWWLSTTPSLQPLLSPPVPALPQDSREHHWPCAIYGAWLHTRLSPLQGKTQARSKGVSRLLSCSLQT